MSPLKLLRTISRSTGSRPVDSEPRPVIATRAELAECTCPDACERDHEQD